MEPETTKVVAGMIKRAEQAAPEHDPPEVSCFSSSSSSLLMSWHCSSLISGGLVTGTYAHAS